MKTKKLELKNKAFEYIMYKMVEWHIELNRLRSELTFNRQNDFEKNKLMLLPFFIVMANKDRKTLLSLFDNFIAAEEGIFDEDLYEYPFGPNFLTLSLLKEKYAQSLEIEQNERLAGYVLVFETRKVSLTKKDFNMENVPYDLIDSSIDYIKKCNKHFVNLDRYDLSSYSRGHTCWLSRKGKNLEIPWDVLEKEKSIFSADPSKHLLI